MLKTLCSSKIHRATVTGADLNYIGSITIDRALLQAANIIEYEKVQIVNINNGSRFETYTIAGPENSGVICLNGAASRLACIGDKIIIIAYTLIDSKVLNQFKPSVVHVDQSNCIIEVNHHIQAGEYKEEFVS